jgi:glycerate kinase
VNVLVAPNALKGSLDAFEAAGAIAEGLARSLPDAEFDKLPIADGGDGTAAVLVRALGGSFADAVVLDPLGRPRHAGFGVVDEGAAGGAEAILEVAQSSGVTLLAATERNPLAATSYGAGQLVLAALDRGCRRIVIGLGGSATVDGGAGFVDALGARLLDAKGAPIARGGAGLAALHRIDVSGLDPRLAEVEIVAVCDVDNALLGVHGAARTFAPQKGAGAEMVDRLEANLTRLADVIERDLGREVGHLKHGGAAGGMAAGIAGILGGRLERGADFVLERLKVRQRLIGKDIVFTAEGQIDRQTWANKGPYALARTARELGIPVVALAGGVSDDANIKAFDPFDAILPICPRPMALEEAMPRAREHLALAAERAGRLLRLGGRLALSRGLS